MRKKIDLKRQKISVSVSLVIPVFNNANTFNLQLQKCINVLDSVCKNYEILISDDKSTDETKKHVNFYLNNKRIKVFYQKRNLGIAKNIQFLYRKASLPLIVLFSVDGDWNPDDIGRLIYKQHATDAGIVIGKRNIKEYSLTRKIVSFIYNILPLLLFQVKTYDTGSIKIFKKEILKTIPLTLHSVSFESEMLIKAAKKGYSIETIPISFARQKKHKQSGVNIKVVLASLIDILKLRLQKI